MPARALTWIVVLAAVVAAALWWARDSVALRGLWPGAVALPAAASRSTGKAPRKCVGASQVVYTDEACPPGTRAQALQGGSVTVLPAAPAAAQAPAAAASVQTPLRRLAGDGVLPDQQERRVDQALHR